MVTELALGVICSSVGGFLPLHCEEERYTTTENSTETKDTLPSASEARSETKTNKEKVGDANCKAEKKEIIDSINDRVRNGDNFLYLKYAICNSNKKLLESKGYKVDTVNPNVRLLMTKISW